MPFINYKYTFIIADPSIFEGWMYIIWMQHTVLALKEYFIDLVSRLMLYFHLYMNMYVYVSVSHQVRLKDTRCFHSCICISGIHLDCYYERFKWMTDPSPGMDYGRAQIIMWISNETYYPYTTQLLTNGNVALCLYKIVKKNAIQVLFYYKYIATSTCTPIIVSCCKVSTVSVKL